MGFLDVMGISHTFGDKALYKNVSFELYKGEHMGLVGQNGAGKSTIMNTIIGEIIPDEGEIKWQNGIKYGYLDQHVRISDDINVFDYLKTCFANLYEIEANLMKLYADLEKEYDEKLLEKASAYQEALESHDFYNVEQVILKVANGLGIAAMGLDKPMKELSGGQRAKVVLAKLLLEKPDVLLLDEPTNYLDKEHIEWIVGYLNDFEGSYIVISHDFEFLDQITNCICDIEFSKVEKYHGNFTKFLKLKEIKRENYVREFASQQNQIKSLETYIAKNKARASTASMAKGRSKQLDKIERITAPQENPKPSFRFTSLPISNLKTLEVNDLTVGYKEPLLEELNFAVDAGQKVVITGFNGVGKSTLLKTLINIIPTISGSSQWAENMKIGYFEQDLKFPDPKASPKQIVMDEFPKISEKVVRQNLAQCGIGSKNVSQSVSSLSGGEQTKVKLCMLMLRSSNVLVLDEPTNHIDADSKAVLKKQLQNWEGAAILVSHETAFYEDWIDKVIEIDKIAK